MARKVESKYFCDACLRSLRRHIVDDDPRSFADTLRRLDTEVRRRASSDSEREMTESYYIYKLCSIYEGLLADDQTFISAVVPFMGRRWAPDTTVAFGLAVDYLEPLLLALEEQSGVRNSRQITSVRINMEFAFDVIEHLIIAWRSYFKREGRKERFLFTHEIRHATKTYLHIPRLLGGTMINNHRQMVSMRSYLPHKLYTNDMFIHTWNLEKNEGKKQYRAAEETLMKFRMNPERVESYLKQYRKSYLNRKTKGTKLP